jgi:hypothetical protein
MHIKFWSESLKGKHDIGVLGERENNTRIKMALKNVGCNNMDRIHVIQGRDGWCALVNTAMNFQVL